MGASLDAMTSGIRQKWLDTRLNDCQCGNDQYHEGEWDNWIALVKADAWLGGVEATVEYAKDPQHAPLPKNPWVHE